MSAEDAAFEALLEFLKRSRGLDFTGYKRPSLQRRFQRRMDTVGCKSFGDYLDYLEVHPDEYEQLFEMLLINVTEFFRDPPVLGAPARDRAARRCWPPRRLDEPVRVWSAGCATGQEAYTAAIAFAELMGVEAFRERVKIYATDIDEDALNQARLGDLHRQGDRVASPRTCASATSSAPTSAGVPQGPAADGHLRPQQPRRRRADLPAGPADLPQHADVLQRRDAGRILRHFHFALRDGGVLMLGKSEMMISHRDLFAPTTSRSGSSSSCRGRPSLRAPARSVNGEAQPPATTSA